MSNVLDQGDIDALLSAVDTGDFSPASVSVGNNGESKIFSRSRTDFNTVEIKLYDFKRPERVSKDQMLALRTLHESFARNFGASLSGYLRMIVEVKVASCEQITYGEFVMVLPNPTSFQLIEVDPLEGRICLEMSPLIIFPIIDRLLGGNNAKVFVPARPLTMIETRLVSKITARALRALEEAWEDIAELKFETVETESNPQLVQIVPPNEVAIVVGFEIRLANRTGTMNLCIPYKVIEPMMDKLSSQNWFSAGKSQQSDSYASQIADSLAVASVGVSALLAETEMTLHDLLNLSVGDILTTEKPASQPVLLCVEGEKKLLANIGQYKGSRALKIIRTVREMDRV